MTNRFPEEKPNLKNARGKKTRNPGYEPGNHWVECEVCACAIRSKDAKVRWDGVTVCPDDWEMRHPQDFVRGRTDTIAAQGIVRPASEDVFVERTTELPTNTIPTATNNNDL